MDTQDISATLHNLNACLSTLEERCGDGLDGRTLGAGLFGSKRDLILQIYYNNTERKYEVKMGNQTEKIDSKAELITNLSNWLAKWGG